jgi:hypothetical protein
MIPPTIITIKRKVQIKNEDLKIKILNNVVPIDPKPIKTRYTILMDNPLLAMLAKNI